MATTTAESLTDLVVDLVKAAGVAGGNVWGVRAWPADPNLFPMIEFMIPEEDKVPLGRNSPGQFTVTATVPIIIHVSQPEPGFDGTVAQGAAAVRGQLVDLCRQLEKAVVGAPELMKQIQQIAFIKIHSKANADGDFITGQRVMLLGLEYYQGPEDFNVVEGDPLERFYATLDAQDPADPTGDYPDPAYPDAVTPAPRLSGPDGRAEGGLDLDLTTPIP